VMSMALSVRPAATLATDRSAIALQINATRLVGKARLTACSLGLSGGSVNRAPAASRQPIAATVTNAPRQCPQLANTPPIRGPIITVNAQTPASRPKTLGQSASGNALRTST